MDISIYTTKDGDISVDVKVEGETVWLSLNQISKLFERDKSVIAKHIKNIFKLNELERNAVVANFATTASDGKTYFVKYANRKRINHQASNESYNHVKLLLRAYNL